MALSQPPDISDPRFKDWMFRFWKEVGTPKIAPAANNTQDHSLLSNLNSQLYSHLTAPQLSALTGAGDSVLHYHVADRARANHTGTQSSSTISDFYTAVLAIIQEATAGLSTWTELEVDFGSTPVYDASFTITNAGISTSSQVVVVPSGKPATGRTADDWQWDGAVFAANPAVGSATCYATFSPGPIVGPRKIQYKIGV